MKSTWNPLRIKNRQNLYLSALLREVKHDNAAAGYPLSNKTLIVVCHGFTGSKEGGGRALAMGNELATLGFSTLLFDFAGCGESDGKWEELTLSGQVDDLSAVVGWCRENGFNRIILMGRSFGGTTALLYAGEDSKIAAVCTWAAVARPALLFRPYLKNNLNGPGNEVIMIKGSEGEVALKRSFFLDLTRHDLLASTGKIAPRNLLIIHGSADETVPATNAHIIYQAAGNPKELAIIEGADHRFSMHLERVWSVFFSWLQSLKNVPLERDNA
jgi:uncharacterized protein